MYKNIKTIYKKTQIITSIIFIIFTLQIKFLFAESNNDNINAKKLNEIIKLIENNNLNKAFQIAKSENSDDLIFFIEDDYIFEENCIEEMIITFSRLSTIFKEDVFLCPCDYPFFYDSSYKTSIYIGNKYKWRTVEETLLTFMMSKKLYDKYKEKIRLVGEKENYPFENIFL